MRTVFPRLACLLTLAAATTVSLAADPGTLTVKVDQPGHKIPATLYGLMTEEINHAYDGGLYAELIQNRTFKDGLKADRRTPLHWTLSGTGAAISLDKTDPVTPALDTSLRVDINGPAGLSNDGFWGVPLKPNTAYTVSYFARASADFSGAMSVSLAPGASARAGLAEVRASADAPAPTAQWKKYSLTLTTGPGDAIPNGRFQISFTGKGSVWLNLVSVMPPTYKNTPNGNRIDLMEKLADLQPAFLRLPGGNYLEGNTIAERFNWKQTIGPLETRPGHMAPWTYRSSDGMGLLEFLRWCEDLKMEPLLGVFAGYALQGEVVTGEALKPHIQDALDEIEYVTGDVNTKWGAQRASDGHPAPFKLTYVEIGNEDFFDRTGSYDSRYAAFHDAIKARYPALQLIATMPVRSRRPDLVDDHYYRSAVAMQNDVHHYDRASRSGPKIFVGEWATTEGSPTPTMNAALGDAAWLTGMERNSDLVVISAYAPLLVNVNPGASQWNTNLIGYDSLRSFVSPSYHVQRMFAQNRGDVLLPVDLVPQVLKSTAETPAPHGGVGAATWATNSQYKDLKVTRPDGTVLFTSDFSKDTAGWKFYNGAWKADAGTLHQTSNATECRAIAGDPAWGDLDYTLKACKVSGTEGFLAMFNVKDSDNYMWFNVGGWSNTRTAIEVAENGARRTIGNDSNFTVETGKWYDLKIEVRGKKVTCFIDGKQICAATYEAPPVPDSMYATASRDDASGDVIVKVVNIAPAAQQMAVNLQGAPAVKAGSAETISGDPSWVNTLAEPEKVMPRKSAVTAAPKFTYEFPAHSVTVLRVKTQ